MTVAWTAPVTGGSPVLAYRVQIATRATGPWVTVRWTSASVHGVIFTGLHNGTRYYARVIAVNRYGAGRPSAATLEHARSRRALRALPAGCAASVGDGRITVAWNTPTNNGGAAVLTYRVQLATGVGGSWVTLKWIPASTHGVVLSGLRNGTRYYARVIAVNSGGPGAPSAPISATPQVVRSASRPCPRRPGRAARERRRRPRHGRLEHADEQRWLGDPDLPRATGEQRHRTVDELAVRAGEHPRREHHRAEERHALLGAGHRGERDRRRRAECSHQCRSGRSVDGEAADEHGQLHHARERARRRRSVRRVLAGAGQHRSRCGSGGR